jgi:oxygen-independent coproporphyrinogen-3 oxidase
MAGLYIHVPFCKSICGYCDFYKTTRFLNKDLFISSLLKEIEIKSSLLIEYPIRTIYFGGGTPSLLQRNDFDVIFKSIGSVVSLANLEEVTIEVNPDDFTREWAESLIGLPINRISFGVQSLYDDLLIMMGRRHSSIQAYNAVLLASELGFDNITVDLIYGLPGLDISMWQKTLKTIVSWPIKHVSAYHLTYEKNTRFFVELNKGLKIEISDDESVLQYDLLRGVLGLSDFVDYEISNFCLPGYESKHNSLYWSGEEYFGLGPSSHSFYNGNRYWNFSDLIQYSKALNQNAAFFEVEFLTQRDVYNEMIMLGLRQRKGFLLSRLSLFDASFHRSFELSSALLFSEGKLVVLDGWCRVSDSARFVVDNIIQQLFVVD